jgi:CRISPR system Cascade subunit CasE
MMHLSLLTLPRSAARWRFLEPYQLHQIIWKGFPGIESAEGSRPFLYRHNEEEKCHSILVQSAVKADWKHLDDEAEGTTTQIRTFDPEGLKLGTRFRFFVRTNPIVERKGYADKASRRIVVGSKLDYVAGKLGVEVETLDDREKRLTEWIERKGAEGGFAIERDELSRPLLMIAPNHDYTIRRSRNRNDDPMTFTGVDFEGILRITDATAFANTLKQGIGRGKAFGFGLLTVAKVA